MEEEEEELEALFTLMEGSGLIAMLISARLTF